MAPVLTADHATKAKCPRVLVVEDEPHLAEMIRDIVGKSVDCRLVSARNLLEAREIMASGTVELMVTDVHLPDGDGTSLISSLRANNPSAETIVITGAPSVDGAIRALRQGALDFLPKPFTADHLIDRVKRGLERQSLMARNERRLDKLRDAVKRLNVARKTVSKKVDLLCNDLVSAYGELSRQLDSVRVQESFRKTVGEAQDLEQLLCHAMDWMLRQIGYSNVALWLAADEGFQLGAYIKYTIAGEMELTDALRDGLLQKTLRETAVHLHADELDGNLSPVEQKYLKDQNVLAINCTYLGESLASVIFFRDRNSPFTDDDATVLKAISPVFAVALASIVKGGQDDGEESGESPFQEGEDDEDNGNTDQDSRRNKKRKPDPADWWKRGETPPF